VAKGVPTTCAAILANAEASRTDMMIAGTTISAGMFMGKPCGRPDYRRAYQLFKEANDQGDINAMIKNLKDRAATGNPKAIAFLESIGVMR
jgi:hypothetical protein